MEIEHDGVSLHVEVDGPAEGSPVVFLHGVSASSSTYAWLPSEVTGGRRIVRVDLRGHGRSGHAPGTYVIDRYGEDVLAVLRQLLARPAVLVGHSLGGVVAWWVAQRAPQLVAAAFLEDPPLYMGELAEHEQNGAVPLFRALGPTAARWQAEGLDVDTVTAQLAATPVGGDRAPAGRELMHQDALRSRAQSLLLLDPGVLDAAADRSTLAATDTSSAVSVAVLVLAADERGSAFPSRHAERLARTHPEVEIVRVSGAGHGIHDELGHRGDYVRELVRFLDAHA
jgi:pimeloyl-ACP methyl ester carboxylesterase